MGHSAPLEQRLTEIVAGLLAELRGTPPPPIAPDADLQRDLGIDSLTRVEFFLRIERAFGVHLPEDGALGARSVRSLVEAPAQASTLLEVLDWHAARHPQRIHVTLLEGDGPGQPLTYGELAGEALAVARGLQHRGLEPGQAVAIMLP